LGSIETLRIVVGSGGDEYAGWHCLPQSALDIVNEGDWIKLFERDSIEAILAEHVLEHLRVGDVLRGLEIAHRYIKPGGWFRIAVPDGYHPSKKYIEAVRPGGSGAGSHDHKFLWNIDTLGAVLELAGFEVRPLEFMDKQGNFHFEEWDPKDGFIKRSARFDGRNKGGQMNYTSLIIDAIKTTALSNTTDTIVEDSWHALPGGPRNAYALSMTRSAETKAPVTALGEPLPWYTYPAIEFVEAFLESRDRSNMSVFEFGAGNSTLYYLRKQVGKLCSVETDKNWFDKLRNAVGNDRRLTLCHLTTHEAPKAILEQGEEIFDIIVVDGRKRNECALYAYDVVAPGGIIIFDNSDRPRYRDAMRFLTLAGLSRIDYYGRSPGIQWKTCTSIFLTDARVLSALPFPSDVNSSLGPTLGKVEAQKVSKGT